MDLPVSIYKLIGNTNEQKYSKKIITNAYSRGREYAAQVKLNGNEIKILNKWCKQQNKDVANKQNKKHPYYGAIGGAYVSTKCPTGFGLVIKTRNDFTKDEIVFEKKSLDCNAMDDFIKYVFRLGQEEGIEEKMFDKDQQYTLSMWKKEQNEKIVLEQKKETPYHEPFEVVYMYTICQTGLGPVVRVENNYTKDRIDLTDYECW